MVCVNIALWAYSMALSPSVWSPVCYFFASIIFVGMLELAKLFSDPFGDDEVDFPVHIWLQKFLENQQVLAEYAYPGAENNFAAIVSLEERVPWNTEVICKFINDAVPPENDGLMHSTRGRTYSADNP